MQPHTDRVIYIVPSDAKEWLDAKQHLTEVLEDLQHFFADEMNQRSHGPKTFEKRGMRTMSFCLKQSTALLRKPNFKPIRCVLSKFDTESSNKSEFIDLRKLKPKGPHLFSRPVEGRHAQRLIVSKIVLTVINAVHESSCDDCSELVETLQYRHR